MTTYTFIAHEVNLSGSNYNVVGSSTFNIVLDDDDPTIGDPGDTGETISIDGGATQSYTYVGTGVTDAGETMVVLEVNGLLYGFNTQGGNLANGTTKLSFADLTTDPVVPCFTADALLRTPLGDVPIALLRAGDTLITRDHGPQKIKRILSSEVTIADQLMNPGLKPVRFAPDAFGNGSPYRTLTVSQQHRFLFGDWRCQLNFGEYEVLTTAKSLRAADWMPDDPMRNVVYYHVLMERHELIWANGALTETILLGADFLRNMPREIVEELRILFPDQVQETDRPAKPAAAPLAKSFEGALL